MILKLMLFVAVLFPLGLIRRVNDSVIEASRWPGCRRDHEDLHHV